MVTNSLQRNLKIDVNPHKKIGAVCADLFTFIFFPVPEVLFPVS